MGAGVVVTGLAGSESLASVEQKQKVTSWCQDEEGHGTPEGFTGSGEDSGRTVGLHFSRV